MLTASLQNINLPSVHIVLIVAILVASGDWQGPVKMHCKTNLTAESVLLRHACDVPDIKFS